VAELLACAERNMNAVGGEQGEHEQVAGVRGRSVVRATDLHARELITPRCARCAGASTLDNEVSGASRATQRVQSWACDSTCCYVLVSQTTG
jgi:hypothetical protein